jgi:hypothetical protein
MLVHALTGGDNLRHANDSRRSVVQPLQSILQLLEYPTLGTRSVALEPIIHAILLGACLQKP